MKVVQVPTLLDNYTYLIICEKTGECGIVDSPDTEATIAAIDMVRQAHHAPINPVAILSTHHHWDHVGGNGELVKWKKMPVYGGDERIPELTNRLKEGDTVQIGEITLTILEIPGHTRGHIAYVMSKTPGPAGPRRVAEVGGPPPRAEVLSTVGETEDRTRHCDRRGFAGDKAVFCGDTLFAGGCGRLFEGTPAMMVASLTKLKNLPDTTKVYCGHEYTQKNLEFALTLEPGNQALKKKYEEVVKKRARNESTVPTTIGEEKSYNPFLRCDKNKDPVGEFAARRILKDRW